MACESWKNKSYTTNYQPTQNGLDLVGWVESASFQVDSLDSDLHCCPAKVILRIRLKRFVERRNLGSQKTKITNKKKTPN